MTFISDAIKGIFIGIDNIIPGVSGGTMALSMGIYDKLIGAVSNFTKDWKKSFLTLLPIIIGCGIGIVGFTYIIEYLLKHHTFVTSMSFIGLIIGGLPMLVKRLKGTLKETQKKLEISSILSFFILFFISVFLPLFGSETEAMSTLTPSPIGTVLIFFIGIIAAATMIIPGVSGSMVLIILGYYYGILDSIKRFLEALRAFDLPALIDRTLLLLPFGLGVLLGIFWIAKLITFLFERYGAQTYCAILGLVVSSPFVVLYNTGVFKQLSSIDSATVIFGLICAVIGFVVTNFLGES